jgi:hypothetical protein
MLKRLFSYEMSNLWFLKLEITENNRDAVVEWLEDRSKFHIWLTSIVTGSVVFFAATQQPQVQITELHSIIKIVSFLLLFLSILTNMICIWSIPTWKYHVKTGNLTQGTIMRLELGISAWISVLSFILGMLGATMFLILPA